MPMPVTALNSPFLPIADIYTAGEKGDFMLLLFSLSPAIPMVVIWRIINFPPWLNKKLLAESKGGYSSLTAITAITAKGDALILCNYIRYLRYT